MLEVLEENTNLESRLMQIVTQKNLNVQLAKDTASVSELVVTEYFPKEERRSREFADGITRIVDKAARGEHITQKSLTIIPLQCHGSTT
jgi:hypothetical protein